MNRARRARIVATLGPASRAPGTVKALAQAGVDVFRLNFSHGSHDDHAAALKAVRGAEMALQRPLGVLLIDLDHFKAYNDTHGHIAGDSCLQDVARRLQAGLPHDALATRYGGEEFCLVLPGMDPERASALAERLRQSIQAMSAIDAGHGAPAVTASIGVVAQVPHGADCADALLSCADRALYQAKEGGRNRVQLAGG